MLYKKIVIFLLLSQASRTIFYGSEEQNKVTSKNKNISEEQGRTIISWNGINYLFINNLYYFSTRKYTFMDARFIYYNVYIKYRRKFATPSYLEKEYSFFARIQEFLYNLFSFSLYFFKKSFFYKIDILGNDVFFYPMTADYTTNILSIILGTTACKISLRDDMELECRFGIGLTWRRLSYAVSYKCKECNTDQIDVTGAIYIIDNKLLYDIKYTEEVPGIGVWVVKGGGVRYKDTGCKCRLNFSILENLKKSYTWKHFDIVINCSLLLRSKVTIYLNLNFGILESWQVYKCHNVKYEYSNENILTFSIPLVLRHLSLNVSYSS